MERKRKTLAGRLIRKMLIWLAVFAIGIAGIIFYLERKATREYYAEIYHTKMLVTNEYTRRVTSDVYVAVTNNIYYLEHNLDDPDSHKATMERIVKSGTRVRSCGISFIADYYPEKGHRFCPYAWRSAKDPDVIYSENMGDADLDYLHADWFTNFLESDSAIWSSPFYDSHENPTPLSAYMVPIHDQTGSTVAVLGADVSLDWLTGKLNEVDSTLNDNAMQLASRLGLKSTSYILYQDGRFITNDDEERILKDNFFDHIESHNGSDVEELVSKMEAGIERGNSYQDTYLVDGEECFVFYTPIKYTKWLMVTVVPSHAIDAIGIYNGFTKFMIIFLTLLAVMVLVYFYIKISVKPVKHLVKSVNDMAMGKFNTPMPEVKHNDEIGELRDAIEKMQYTISNHVEEAKK